MRRTVVTGLAGAGLLAAAGAACLAPWPNKPITLIVPWAAGGSTDILGKRIVGQKLSQALHQPVVIDNKAGAGGTLGAGIAARAPADGSTFFLATIAHTLRARSCTRTPPYDFSKDLDPGRPWWRPRPTC